MIGAGLTPKTTLLLMLIAPALEAMAFWGILRHNNHIFVDETASASNSRRVTSTDSPTQSIDSKTAVVAKEETDENGPEGALDMERNSAEELEPLTDFKSKLRYIPKLLVYMVPLTLVYLLEYFINQGLVI